jgi:hypothetical protein
MTVVHKRVNHDARLYGRGVSFISPTDFGSGDTIDIEKSISGSGRVVVETAAASTCSFRINSMYTRYPLYEPAKKLNYPAPDLQNGAVVYNTDLPTTDMGAGEILEIDLPVANLTFAALTGTVTVTIKG